MSKNVLVVSKKNFVNQAREILSQLPFSVEIAINRQEINKKAKNVGRGRQLRLGVLRAIQQSKKDFIVVSSCKRTNVVLEAKDFDAADYITKPFHYREFIARLNAIINKKTRISCIGGGTGLFNLLLGLKTLPDILLTFIVSMTDDGGSSGRLRASFGVLPPGDVRRSLVALSNAPEFMNQVMQYRFEKGQELSGHSFGNLFLTVLAEIKGTMLEAIKGLGDILNIQGIVFPVAHCANEVMRTV